jgi:hypothetical protein
MKELQMQVDELIMKGYIHESMNPCTVQVLLMPKKNGTWRMCVDCRAINNITIKYKHLSVLRDEKLYANLSKELPNPFVQDNKKLNVLRVHSNL